MAGIKTLKKIVHKAKQARADHKERHRPSGFGFAFADSIDYLDGSQWDQVTSGSSVFISRDYLRVLEAAGPKNSRQRYALMFRGKEPVAAISAQLVSVSAGEVPKPGLRKPLAKSLKHIHENVLICGNLLSWGGHGFAFAAGQDPKELWPGIAEALYRIRRADRLMASTDVVMIKDVPGTLMHTADSLKRISYRAIETEPNMVLSISPKWSCFEDYLGALTSSYRKTARKTIDEVQSAGLIHERLDRLDDHGKTLHDLYLQVHERQAMRLVTLTPEFLPALARTFGDRFRCSVLRKDDRIAGFVTTLQDGETAVGYYIGFDSQTNANVPLYFRLLQAVVDDAIQMGCRKVSFGRTALEPKARLGARPEPFHIWVRHRVPAMNLLVRGLLHSIPHDEAPERSPFKADKANP